MCIKNKTISLIYKILLVVIGIYGLYENCLTSKVVKLGEQLSYYTNLSNLFCIIFFIFYIFKIIFDLKIKNIQKIKGALTIAITVTMFIFNLVLRPFMFDMDGVIKLNSLGNYIVHLIIPLMVIFDYVLFDEKGLYEKKDPLIWLILPFSYFIFTIIRASIGEPFTYTASRYPYFFIDIDAFGLDQVLFNVVLIIVAITLLGYMFLWLDKKLKIK